MTLNADKQFAQNDNRLTPSARTESADSTRDSINSIGTDATFGVPQDQIIISINTTAPPVPLTGQSSRIEQDFMRLTAIVFEAGLSRIKVQFGMDSLYCGL